LRQEGRRQGRMRLPEAQAQSESWGRIRIVQASWPAPSSPSAREQRWAWGCTFRIHHRAHRNHTQGTPPPSKWCRSSSPRCTCRTQALDDCWRGDRTARRTRGRSFRAPMLHVRSVVIRNPGVGLFLPCHRSQATHTSTRFPPIFSVVFLFASSASFSH
jgi:hypothetical protein